MYDEEIEKAVLYFVIFQHYEFILDVKDFAIDRNQKIIQAINQIKSEKAEISMLAVVDKIHANRNQVLEYLSNLGLYVFGMTAEGAYNKLIEYSKKRQTYELLQRVVRAMSKWESQNERIDIVIEKTIDNLQQIQGRNLKTETFQDLVFETMSEIEKNYKNQSDYSLYTGLIDLDKMTLGLHRQELTIIGARPGIGKTTLALQIAEHVMKNGLQVGFVSLEMSSVQLIQKMIAKESKVNSYKLRAGTLEEKDFAQIAKICGDLKDLPFQLISKTRTIQDIEVKARQLKNKGELDLLVIDYLQLVKNSNKFGSREQEVADISRTLKLLSLELDIPIIALCQLNRNATRNEPTLADLRESGSIEQDADNVIFLYQEEGQEEMEEPVVVAKLAKQRAGSIGKVKLQFRKAMSEFISLIR